MLFLFVYARTDGGLGQPLIAGLTGTHVLSALASAALLLAVFGGGLGLALLPLALALAVLLGGWCQRHLLGITGDLIGASIAISELVFLLIWAAAHPTH